MKYLVYFEIGSKNDDVAMPEKCYTISQGCIVVFFIRLAKMAVHCYGQTFIYYTVMLNMIL